jgi:hypothetical protein
MSNLMYISAVFVTKTTLQTRCHYVLCCIIELFMLFVLSQCRHLLYSIYFGHVYNRNQW